MASWFSHRDGNFNERPKHRKPRKELKPWQMGIVVIILASIILLTVAYFVGG